MPVRTDEHARSDDRYYDPDEVFDEGDPLVTIYRLDALRSRVPIHAREKADKVTFRFFFDQENMTDAQYGVVRGQIKGALKNFRRHAAQALSRTLRRRG